MMGERDGQRDEDGGQHERENGKKGQIIHRSLISPVAAHNSAVFGAVI
jgi:hypothetical protein